MNNQEQIEHLQNEVERLKERCGYWKRLAKNQSPKSEFLRQGHRIDPSGIGIHYKVYSIKGIPADLPMRDVLKELDDMFLQYQKYRYAKADYSSRTKSWHVQVEHEMDVRFIFHDIYA